MAEEEVARFVRRPRQWHVARQVTSQVALFFVRVTLQQRRCVCLCFWDLLSMQIHPSRLGLWNNGAWTCWKKPEFDQLCLVKLAHNAGINVRVFLLSLLRQNQCIWTDGIEVTVHCCCSILGAHFRQHCSYSHRNDGTLLVLSHRIARPVLKHTKESPHVFKVFCVQRARRNGSECPCALAINRDLEDDEFSANTAFFFAARSTFFTGYWFLFSDSLFTNY